MPLDEFSRGRSRTRQNLCSHETIEELEAAGPEAVALAKHFSDQWDRYAFDPNFDTPSLEHFEPLVREIFTRATSPEEDT